MIGWLRERVKLLGAYSSGLVWVMCFIAVRWRRMRPEGISVVCVGGEENQGHTQHVDVETQCLCEGRGLLRAPATFGQLLEQANVNSQGDGVEGCRLAESVAYVHGEMLLKGGGRAPLHHIA